LFRNYRVAISPKDGKPALPKQGDWRSHHSLFPLENKRTTFRVVLLFFVLVRVGFSTPWGRGCGIIWLMHEVRRGKLWLDANAVSASPKGQSPAAKRGLDFDIPVPALKQKA